MWPKLISTIMGISLSILLLEMLLRLTDPWGAVRYFTATGPTLDLYIPYGERDVLPAGDYHFSSWSAHINPDHSRFVPDNGAGNCKLAFVGDSVTFGLGVNDAETWVNLIASHHPEWNAINSGVAGYNSYAVRLTIADTPADMYIYLITNNDADLQLFHPVVEPHHTYHLALQIYWRTWQIQQQAYERPPEMIGSGRRFDRDILTLSSHENILILGFANDELAQSAHDLSPSVILVPPYTEPISFADPHPNQAGHRQIADTIDPFITEYSRAFCPQDNRW
jgi:hypothetical protein